MLGRAIKLMWAGPASLVGLLLAPFFDGRRIEDGIVVAEGARWPRRLGWRYTAITFGHVVLATQALDEATMAHERVHVRQYERWGPLFFPAYLVASLVALLQHRDAYLDNPFEIEARETAAALSSARNEQE